MFSFRTRIFCSVLAVALLSIGIAAFYGKAGWNTASCRPPANACCMKPASAVILGQASPDPDVTCRNWPAF